MDAEGSDGDRFTKVLLDLVQVVGESRPCMGKTVVNVVCLDKWEGNVQEIVELMSIHEFKLRYWDSTLA